MRLSKKELVDLIIKLAREGYTSASIGQVLRDKHEVRSVKQVLGKGIAEVMQEHGVYQELPEDLFNLLKRAVNLREHLAKHRKDKHSRRGLELMESRIRSLVKYYKRRGLLPKDWTYDPEKAKLLVRR
jgi:small subunit ribosomal protein S15